MDEADKSLAKSWMTVLNHFDGTANVCGFSATHLRSDKRSLGEYYESVAFEATQKDRALRRAMLSSRGRGLSIVNEGPVSLPPIGPSSSNRLTKG